MPRAKEFQRVIEEALTEEQLKEYDDLGGFNSKKVKGNKIKAKKEK